MHLNESPWILEREARQIALEAIRSVCRHRQWIAHAIHIRATHVHAVITGEAAPERMLSDFKAYATRALRLAFPDVQRQRYWANHGSTRYLWNEVSFRAAMDYVLNGQGERMSAIPIMSKISARIWSLTLPAPFQYARMIAPISIVQVDAELL